MNQRRIFTKPVTFLIIAVLAATAFTKGDLRNWLTIGAFAITGLWLVIPILLRRRGKPRAVFQKNQKRFRVKRIGKTPSSSVFQVPDISDSVPAVLLRHVNHRVSAYLKSVYPDVTWEWVSEQPERLAARGGTGRIRLFGVPDFNFADVVFDQMARIDCDFLRIVPLTELKTSSGIPAADIKNDQPTDPEVWYSKQGKAALDACIADLHSHGFSSLMINENGDIRVKKGDQEMTYETLKSFPAKPYWAGLTAVLGKAGWSASATDTGIAVSW